MDKQALAQAYSEAPQALQAYLKSKDFETRVLKLVSDISLPTRAFLPLKNASVLIFLSITDSSSLVENLQRTLSLDEAKAALVAKKLDEMVVEEIEAVLEEKTAETIKELKLSGGEGGDLRVSMLAKKEAPMKPSTTAPIATPQAAPRTETSRTMLMDQLSLIGQIPKDEDVLQRLNKIKEQLRRGEEAKAKLDEEIKKREAAEKIKSLEASKVHVTRRVYDIDPYREHVAGEDLEL